MDLLNARLTKLQQDYQNQVDAADALANENLQIKEYFEVWSLFSISTSFEQIGDTCKVQRRVLFPLS